MATSNEQLEANIAADLSRHYAESAKLRSELAKADAVFYRVAGLGLLVAGLLYAAALLSLS